MKYTEGTEHLVRQYEAARKIDLDALFGSGLDVAVYRYGTNEALVERVTVAPEDASHMVEGLIDALESALIRRRAMLRGEMAMINKHIPGAQE